MEHGELLRPDLGLCMQRGILWRRVWGVHDMCDGLAGRLRWFHGLL